MRNYLTAFGMLLALSPAFADESSKCRLYGTCREQLARDKPADYVGGVDQKGWQLEPAEASTGNDGFGSIGKNVEIDLKSNLDSFGTDDQQRKFLRESEMGVGTIHLNTQSGTMKVDTPPAAKVP